MNYERRENESLLSYYKRITDNRKEYDLDYSEWASLISGREYSSENGRKAFYVVKPMLDLLDNDVISKLPKNKIEEIQDVIGELDIKKIEVRNRTSEMNKIKKDLVKNVEIARYLEEVIERESCNFMPLYYDKYTVTSEKKLIVHISDWHVGYVIKGYKGNTYNYNVAKKRLAKLLSEIENVCTCNDINQVIVAQAGDLTEGTYMRKNQSYECEFNSNEQIVMAEELLYGFVSSISEFANVDLYSVGGNHQRGNGDKDANIEGDNNNLVIVKNLQKCFKLVENNRVTVHDIDFIDDTAIFDVNGLRFKLLHGDNRISDNKKMFNGEVSMDDEKCDVILRGHFHNFNIVSQNKGGYVITAGCLFGYNPYSVKRMSCNTNASQTLIVVGDREIDFIKNVDLQHAS